MVKKEVKQDQVAKTNNEDGLAPIEDAENMNMMAQFVNHLLTPGSALSGTMQTAFNLVMVVLFMMWGAFLASMPDSVHVWVFGLLIIGLTLSTNWFLNEVMKMKEEIAAEEKDKKKTDGDDQEQKQIKENTKKEGDGKKKKKNVQDLLREGDAEAELAAAGADADTVTDVKKPIKERPVRMKSKKEAKKEM